MFPSDFNPEKKTRQRYFAREKAKRGLTESVSADRVEVTKYRVMLTLSKDGDETADFLFDLFEDKDWEYEIVLGTSGRKAWVEVTKAKSPDEALKIVKQLILQARSEYERESKKEE